MSEPLRSLAYVNHARWVADCAGCPSAQVLDPGQTRFQCVHANCLAESVVVWPEDPQTIDALLAGRPPQNRNWHPWETTADLLVENIEHGVTPVKGLT
jgi:hypothetical protein